MLGKARFCIVPNCLVATFTALLVYSMKQKNVYSALGFKENRYIQTLVAS